MAVPEGEDPDRCSSSASRPEFGELGTNQCQWTSATSSFWLAAGCHLRR
jgi:hypothetical protein